MDFLSDLTAARAAVIRRDISVEALVSRFLSRIAEGNHAIGAIRAVAPDMAIDAARVLDRQIAAGGPILPLAGMPVLIKENCDTKGMPCSAGMPFRSGYVPSHDAPVVKRLRDAGAIILGVSVSDPGAFGVRTTEVTHPYASELTVGGSSGGSAAALAAGYCLAALGTDTGGSVRIPSACCGTVGLKPGYGTLPMDGVYPLIPSLDHVGIMAKTVQDVRVTWDALCPAPTTTDDMVAVAFDPDWVAETDAVIAASFYSVLENLHRSGIIVREVSLPPLNDVVDMHGKIFFLEGAVYHNARFGNDIQHYPALAQDWFEAAFKMPVSLYINACQRRARLTNLVNQIFENVDLILTPALSVLHPRKDANELVVSGKPLDFTLAMVRQTCLFNHTGHPALVMPSGIGNELPPSLQIICRNGDESRMLAFASRLE